MFCCNTDVDVTRDDAVIKIAELEGVRFTK